MATLNGAIALGVAQKYGTLTAGKKPALSFIAHPDANSNQSPFEWMFDIESEMLVVDCRISQPGSDSVTPAQGIKLP